MTYELTRIDEQGNPLRDTWSNYDRLHDWMTPVPVEEGLDPQFARVQVICWRCRQYRRVWHGASLRIWGCPDMPWRYRLGFVDWPMWSVNEPPPWVRR